MQVRGKHQIHEMMDSSDEVALVMPGIKSDIGLIKVVSDWSNNSVPEYNSSKGSSTICYLAPVKFICVP